MLLTNRQERARFFRFVVVGSIGFLVDFGTFNILRSLLNIQPVVANVLSFTAAVISNFVWNRYWTYPDSRSKRISHQFVEFVVVSLSGLAIRTPIFALLLQPMRDLFGHLPSVYPLTPEKLGDNAALAIAVIIVLFWNFFVNRYWTYADVK